MLLGVFSIFGLLVIALIYFVLRAQACQRELILARSTARSNAKKVSFVFTNMVMITAELQNVFSQRLETANNKGLLKSEDYKAANTLIKHFAQVVMDCCEKGCTVEEALSRGLKNADVSLSDIKNLIKKQPSDVRVAWSKNTANGFITACNNLSQSTLSVDKTDQKLEAS